MKLTSLFFACSLLSFQIHATEAKKSFKIQGQTISANVETLSPPFEITEKAKSSNPVVQCYVTYDQLLAEGKIEEASKLTVSPTTSLSQQKAYVERLGGPTAYKKKMREVLTTKSRLTHIVSIGTSKMLIGSHPTYGEFANFLDCSKQCLLTDDVSHGDMAKLGLIFNQLQEGKIKL